MWQDLRIGIRMLRRSPGVSILAILCLTLGIGANAAVFSWIEGILLRPYPQVVNLDRLFVLSGTSRERLERHRRFLAGLRRSARGAARSSSRSSRKKSSALR